MDWVKKARKEAKRWPTNGLKSAANDDGDAAVPMGKWATGGSDYEHIIEMNLHDAMFACSFCCLVDVGGEETLTGVDEADSLPLTAPPGAR